MSRMDVETAPCLEKGSLSEPGRALAERARELGDDLWASTVKAWSVPFLFHIWEEIVPSPDEPTARMQEALRELAGVLHQAASGGLRSFVERARAAAEPETSDAAVEQVTGRHYGRLFREFSPSSYRDETPRLLATRLERNGITPEDYRGRRVLDAGCGGGRYTVAWRRLGAAGAEGVDISEINVEEATRRAAEAGVDGVRFRRGNVLDLPYADDSFDVVFSNGVLHHTSDWRRGVHEILRVLRPGGWGWLYLIEDPGGLYWDMIEILRVVTRGVDRDLARRALRHLGIPGNRIFFMLDHVMVPINVRLRPRQVEDALAAAGARDVRRLERGTDFDRIEAIHRGIPFAEVKFGVGENRYVFIKPQ